MFPKPEKKKKKKSSIKRGNKTNEWEAVKKQLIPAFEKAGITTCELVPYFNSKPEYAEYVSHFRHWYFLTFAHGKKRRNLIGNELSTLVILACVDCHHFIEYRSEMQKIVKDVIALRKRQPEIDDYPNK